MILWFLRLFPRFRDLESLAQMQAESAEETGSLVEDVANLERVREEMVREKLLLEDRLSAALADKDRLWEAMQQAMDGERYALHTMVNHAVAKSGGGTPYQDAHTLPPSEIRKVQTPGYVGRRGRTLPSEMAEKETEKFLNSWLEQINPQATEKVA